MTAPATTKGQIIVGEEVVGMWEADLIHPAVPQDGDMCTYSCRYAEVGWVSEDFEVTLPLTSDGPVQLAAALLDDVAGRWRGDT